MNPVIRAARMADVNGLYFLFQAVAQQPGGLARTMEEASEGYVRRCLEAATQRGLAVLAEGDGPPRGVLWAWRPEPASLKHTFSELTVAVHPEAQGKGLGRALFEAFLETVRTKHPGIQRVELICRESNKGGLKLYESLGFIREGRFNRRILDPKGRLEADIPMAWFNPNFKA
jgi:ribosomal protein S18 acetylase RimI-like enzyme